MVSLEAMDQAACLLKPETGLLFLTVPIGPDAVVYNAHRIYGNIRLPMLLRGWTVVDMIGEMIDLNDEPGAYHYSEPILVLKRES